MKKMKIIGITTTSLILAYAMMSTSVYAYGYKNKDREGLSNTIIDLAQAIDQKDYQTWKNIVQSSNDSTALQTIDSEDSFNKLVTAQQLAQKGDCQSAKQILNEIGVNSRHLLTACGNKDTAKTRQYKNRSQSDEQVKQALIDNNYEVWKNLMEKRGGRINDYIKNREDFLKFAQAKRLQYNGDYQSAKTILDELNFPFRDREVCRFK